MASVADTILRVILLVFSIIALGLTAGWVHDDTGSSRIRFAVFASCFSILFGCFYGLAAAFIEAIAFPLAMAVVDFLNWVFLFAAATAIAAKTGAGSCSNHNTLKKHDFKSTKDCRLAQAGTAFLYFAWAVAVGNFVYSIIGTLHSGAIGRPGRKTNVPRTGIPTASQV
nr:Nce2 [Starmerella bombicola]